MGPSTVVPSSTALRVLTQRISNTPSKQLPHIASLLGASITECRNLFTASQEGSQSRDASENDILVHKLKIQISALLQDRMPEARYAAVIMIKATVEVGNYGVLQGIAPWIRGLIGILGRPDPPSTKKLCIITLSRVFLLTHEHQSLVREITTPSLSGFITICLNVAQGSGINVPLLPCILHALGELIPLHPTSFRPFVSRLQKLALSLIAPTPSDLGSDGRIGTVPTTVSDSARTLLVLLHVCSPKNTAGEEWARLLEGIMAVTHRTVDRVFRALIEDWRPRADKSGTMQMISAGEVVCDQKPEPMPLPAWTGIHAGIERLDGLLRTIQAFLAATTSAPVSLPVSEIINLVNRVLSVLQPSSTGGSRYRPEIGRDEREGLTVSLPHLHESAIDVLSLMISRVGHGFAALLHDAIEQVFWVLENEHEADGLRTAAYKILSQVISSFGPSLPRSFATSLGQCITLACADLLPQAEDLEQGPETSVSSIKTMQGNNEFAKNVDSYLKCGEKRSKHSYHSIAVQVAAQKFLPLTLTRLPRGFLPFTVRCQIDQTAVLTNNKEMMLASAMNTQVGRNGRRTRASILPLLARASPEALEVETLLRPQIPIIQSGHEVTTISDVDEDKLFLHGNHRNDTGDRSMHSNLGFNGNTNHNNSHVRENLGGDSVGLMTTGVPATFQTAPTGLAEPESGLSRISNKRDREEEPSIDTSTVGSNIATLGSGAPTEVGATTKRARFTHGGHGAEGKKGIFSLEAETQEATAPISSISEAVGSTGAQFDVEDGSSESGFEMPTLHLESDTDENDEEDDG